MRQNYASSSAFTLIELLVVITVIVVLAAVALPAYTGVQERARVVQDMSNLRQIGLATQMCINDNDGAIFATGAGAGTWQAQLHPKYIGSWKIFQSPFDQRSPSEQDANAPISYGLNGNTKGGGTSIAGLLVDKIQSASSFIIFAPAQDSGGVVKFSGLPGRTSPFTKPVPLRVERTVVANESMQSLRIGIPKRCLGAFSSTTRTLRAILRRVCDGICTQLS